VSRRGDNFGLTNTVFSVVWPTGVFASYLRRILAFADSSWADDKNYRRSSMACQQCDLFMACYPLLQIIALSTTEAELMALASCCCEIVWAGKLALD